MAVPASIDEIEEFTPSVLKNAPVPPVFLLRPAGGREYRDFEHELRRRALTFFTPEDIRAETLNALRQLWSEDAYEANRARLESHWAMLDQGGTPSEDELAAVEELNSRLVRAWPKLAEMIADTMRFNDECGRIAASMFIVGWRGLSVPFSRESGVVPLGRIDEVESALHKLEKEAAENKVEGVLKPGMAFIQLTAAAYGKLALTRSEEKNSSSPPPSTPDPSGSTQPMSKPTGGRKSKASASSESATA